MIPLGLRSLAVRASFAMTACASLTVLASQPPPPSPPEPDSKLAYLKANAIPFRTIEPADDDFSDLLPLKALIGERRVVMLGEQSHGDGACFKTKSRLVRFLHQEMGFTVLSWECGLFDCLAVDDAFRKGEPADKAWEHGIFGIWSLSKEAFPAIEYARATYDTQRPLIMAGFDNQFTSGAGPKRLPAFLAEFFDRANEGVAEPDRLYTPAQRAAIEKLAARFEVIDKRAMNSEPAELGDVLALLGAIDAHRERLEKAHDSRRVSLVERVLLNLVAFTRQLVASASNDHVTAGNIRDKAMGQTLAFLADVYEPDRKIIAWAASMHTTRDAKGVRLVESPIVYDDSKTMGQWVDELLGDEVYSIMFTAARGEAGVAWNKAFPIAPPREGSLEALFDQVGPDHFLLDFRTLRDAADAPRAASTPAPTPHWLMTPQVARPFGYAWGRAIWPRHFDAVIFNRAMTKSTHTRWK